MTFDKATTIQFVIFTLDDELQSERLFIEAFGAEPDEVQKNRSVTPQKNFLSLATSSSTGRVKTVRTSPGRIDFQISAKEQTMGKPEIETFDAPTAIEELLHGISSVNFYEKEFLRLAVNAALMSRKQDINEVRDAFYTLTGAGYSYADSQDMLMQINRRRKTSHGVDINRLVQYIMALVQMGQFQLNTAGMAPTSMIELHGMAVQLDFNTVPGNFLIQSAGVFDLFQELCHDVQHAISNPSIESVFYG